MLPIRLHRLWSQLVINLRRSRNLQYFSQCGEKFLPLGPIILRNEGTLIAGNELTIRSFAYQPVEITIEKGACLRLGSHIFLNQGVRIGCSVSITIHDNCLIGDETLILDSDWHNVGERPIRREPIVIGPNVWIAARCIILRGVTIGEGVVIGAGSVVTHSIAPNSLVGGAPARVIRDLKSSDRVRESQ